MKRLLILTLILFTFTGCYLKSVHPLINEEQAELLPGLEGIWEGEDQRWTFINDGNKFDSLDHLFETSVENENFQGSMEISPDNIVSNNSYIMIFENLQDSKTDSSYFFATTGRINGMYFLDLYPIDLDTESSFISVHLQPVHSFSRLQLTDNELEIEFFKDSWIKGLIENNQVRIKHEKVEDDILITASNKELRKFVEKYSGDERAFDDPLMLKNVYKAL